MKTLKCRDLGFDCDAVIHASSEDDVLQQAAAHAQAVHQLSITPELAEQVKGMIRTE